MKFINCNDILQEKNGGICRDAGAARIPTDTPSIFVKSLFLQILRNKTSNDLADRNMLESLLLQTTVHEANYGTFSKSISLIVA